MLNEQPVLGLVDRRIAPFNTDHPLAFLALPLDLGALAVAPNVILGFDM